MAHTPFKCTFFSCLSHHRITDDAQAGRSQLRSRVVSVPGMLFSSPASLLHVKFNIGGDTIGIMSDKKACNVTAPTLSTVGRYCMGMLQRWSRSRLFHDRTVQYSLDLESAEPCDFISIIKLLVISVCLLRAL